MEEHKPAQSAAYESSTTSFSVPGNIAVASSGPQTQLEAVSRVLNTAELLETILLQVPFISLLRLESTCQGFRSAIEGSIKIQRLMHRAPDHSASPRKDSYLEPKGIEVGIHGKWEGKPYDFRLWLEPSRMAAALRQSPSSVDLEGKGGEYWMPFHDREFSDIENENGLTFADMLNAMDEFESKDCARHADGCVRRYFVYEEIVRKG